MTSFNRLSCLSPQFAWPSTHAAGCRQDTDGSRRRQPLLVAEGETLYVRRRLYVRRFTARSALRWATLRVLCEIVVTCYYYCFLPSSVLTVYDSSTRFAFLYTWILYLLVQSLGVLYYFLRVCVCVCVCARARVCVRACVRVCTGNINKAYKIKFPYNHVKE